MQFREITGSLGSAAHHHVYHQIYDEDGFRQVLTIERKRVERSGRPLLLMLVTLKARPGIKVTIEPAVAATLFSRLSLLVRETDVVGWYRQSRVAGAVMSDCTYAVRDAMDGIIERVRDDLRNCLPAPVVQRLRLRVRQLRPRATR